MRARVVLSDHVDRPVLLELRRGHVCDFITSRCVNAFVFIRVGVALDEIHAQFSYTRTTQHRLVNHRW